MASGNSSNQAFKLGLIFFVQLVVSLLWAWVLPFNEYPDECLHFKTAEFIYRYRRMPVAYQDPVTFIREEETGCVGNTYTTLPFLVHLLAFQAIEWGDLFGIEREYLRARMPSVIFGLLFVFFLFLFLRRLFADKKFIVFPALVSTVAIPQVTFAFATFNAESYSLFTSSFLLFASLYFWQKTKRYLEFNAGYLFFGLAVGAHLFSKYNFYLLFAVPIFLVIKRFFSTAKKKVFVANFLLVFVLVFLLSGWFFIRNHFLYQDFFGLRTYRQIYRENLGGETLADLGWDFYDVLFRTNWLPETLESFYGRFGYMSVTIDSEVQWVFRIFVYLGVVGLIKKVSQMRKKDFFKPQSLLYLNFLLLIPISFYLSIKNSIEYDFQAQGRYVFPILIPLMVLVNRGIFELAKSEEAKKNLTIAIITGSVFLNFWAFIYLPKLT